MHTVEEIKAEYRRLDRILNIDTSKIEIAFSNRSAKRHGSCKLERQSDGVWAPVKILIAGFLRDDDEKFWDTVRHEYAHAATAVITGEKHGHDALWKAVCKKVGCSGKVYAENTGVSATAALSKAKYKLVCSDCGAESLYIRETKLIRTLKAGRKNNVVCCRCKGSNIRLFELR